MMKRSLSALLPALALGLLTTLAAPAARADEETLCQIHCGPAPCCMILWVTLCGCPWGEPQLPQVAALDAPAPAAPAAACSAAPPASLLDTLAAAR
jgi:hypothetical protein